MAAIPGLDQALITRNALAGGRLAGIATMLGGASGIGVHATAAAFGLSANSRRLRHRIHGGEARRRRVPPLSRNGNLAPGARSDRRRTVPEQAKPVRLRTFGRQGLLSNALNPKVALYVALLDRIAASLRRRRVRQTVERATAAFLATFAVRPALERG
jgi:threonine/homoserine/homoserine lactone efflux protein